MIKRLLVFAFICLVSGVAYANDIYAKGDGFVVTYMDVEELSTMTSPSDKPTRAALIEQAIKLAIFARAADVNKLTCAGTEGLKGVRLTHKKANCYLENYIINYKIDKDAVDSFYYANWKGFTAVDGKFRDIDNVSREGAANMLKTKAQGKIIDTELRRLAKLFNVSGINLASVK